MANPRTRAKKKPGPAPERTAAEFIDALTASHGVKAAAARVLGCHRKTVDEAIERWAEVKAAYEEAREGGLDESESTIFLLRDDPKAPPAVRLAAATFHLRTVGRGRGYGDRLTLDGSLDVSKLTDEQLAAIAAGKDPDAA